ncbi:unnamed protein product [Phyllotreta striolata]|uniref:Uncharacterized protein n=1 Tax=Phyllotreta striolata TaxID=444603 RepID=A0A9N9U0F0_PHYSR|nr:unnamed protein product [Phyllotreta striolata]
MYRIATNELRCPQEIDLKYADVSTKEFGIFFSPRISFDETPRERPPESSRKGDVLIVFRCTKNFSNGPAAINFFPRIPPKDALDPHRVKSLVRLGVNDRPAFNYASARRSDPAHWQSVTNK